MKRLLGIAILCAMISMTGCGSTSVESGDISETEEYTTTEIAKITEESTTEEITTEPVVNISINEICNWVTSDIWNTGFCDISHYIEDGKSSIGETMDIDFTISNLDIALKKKELYNEYILSLDGNIPEYEQLQNAWVKMCEQIENLYTKIKTETPRAADSSYAFDTGLFKQYFETFYKLCGEIDNQTIIDDITEPVSETTQTTIAESSTTSEYVNAIGDILPIEKITPMAAGMIGAIEGTSFYYNGNKFEIYRYNYGAKELEEASTGQFTSTIDGFGDFVMHSTVNGNYIMVYNTDDSAVIQTFSEIRL